MPAISFSLAIIFAFLFEATSQIAFSCRLAISLSLSFVVFLRCISTAEVRPEIWTEYQSFLLILFLSGQQWAATPSDARHEQRLEH